MSQLALIKTTGHCDRCKAILCTTRPGLGWAITTENGLLLRRVCYQCLTECADRNLDDRKPSNRQYINTP